MNVKYRNSHFAVIVHSLKMYWFDLWSDHRTYDYIQFLYVGGGGGGP